MIDIREHGGPFGGGSIRKGQRIPFQKTTAQQPILRFSDQMGDSTSGLDTATFLYDPEKKSVFYIFYNNYHQWREYKVGMNADKNNNYKTVTPTTTGGATISITGTPFKALKYNNKYFVFYSSGLLVVDAATMKIISEHAGTNYSIWQHSQLQRIGNFAYYCISNNLMRINLDSPSTTPVIINSATNSVAVVDSNEAYFYRMSGNSLVKYTMANSQVYSKVIGAGETFYSSLRTLNIDHKSGNLYVLAFQSNKPVLIIVSPSGDVISRTTYTAMGVNALSTLDLTDNHVVFSGGSQFGITDYNGSLLLFENKDSPNGYNFIARQGYLMYTWTRYNNTSSYANKIYELDILI